MTNNDGENNTPAKVPCCQDPAKNMSDVQVDLEILNQAHQEPQISQNPARGCYFREASISN